MASVKPMPEEAADCSESTTSGHRLANSRRRALAFRFTNSNPKPKAPRPKQMPSASTLVELNAQTPASPEIAARAERTPPRPNLDNPAPSIEDLSHLIDEHPLVRQISNRPNPCGQQPLPRVPCSRRHCKSPKPACCHSPPECNAPPNQRRIRRLD